MATLTGKTAIVTGGSSGVGKATVKALIAEGARVTVVGRDADRLRALAAELEVTTVQGDASDPAIATKLLRDRPDYVVLAAGITPKMTRFDEMEWDVFSETWNTDLKASFHFLKQALAQPLAAGSTIVMVSSGAAVGGSPLSGGYAGAKRMQWMLASYAQKISDAKQLGIRVLAIVPRQLMEGTTIGDQASAAYGAMSGISGEAFRRKNGPPMHPEHVAAAIMSALRGEVASGVTAIAVTGDGVEPL